MKFSIFILAMVLCSAALAFPHEVECSGKYDGKKINVTVEQNFGGSPYDFRDAEISVDGVVTKFEVRGGPFGSYDYSYDNDGFSLRVDFWPDNGPRWGMQYDGAIITSVLNNVRVRNLRCRFPNAM